MPISSLLTEVAPEVAPREVVVTQRERRETRTYKCAVGDIAAAKPHRGDLLEAGSDMRVDTYRGYYLPGEKQYRYAVEFTNALAGTLLKEDGMWTEYWDFGTQTEELINALDVTGKWDDGTAVSKPKDLRIKIYDPEKADWVGHTLSVPVPYGALVISCYSKSVDAELRNRIFAAMGCTNDTKWRGYPRDAWRFASCPIEPEDGELWKLTYKMELYPANRNAKAGWNWQPGRSAAGAAMGPIWRVHPRVNFDALFPPGSNRIRIGIGSTYLDARHRARDWRLEV